MMIGKYSDEAKKIALEAATTEDGLIMWYGSLGGMNIQAGEWEINELEGREKQRWMDGLVQLLSRRLIYESGDGMYELTTRGWQFTDSLKTTVN